MTTAAAKPTAGRSVTATGWLLGLLDVVGSQPLGGSMRQCPNPGHGGDAHPSLSVTARENGGARLHCFAGCPEQEVLRSLGLGVRQLYQPPAMTPSRYAAVARLRLRFKPVVSRRGHPASRGFRLEAVHTYAPAETGDRVAGHELLRWRLPSTGDKELVWETRLAGGSRLPGLLGVSERALPLYRERELRMAVPLDEPVLVVESESSVDALTGWYATTWAGGAAHPNIARLTEVLGGYTRTVLIPDVDPAGLRCLRTLLAGGLGPAVLLGACGEDARDLLRRLGPARFGEAVHAALGAPAGQAIAVTGDFARLPFSRLPETVIPAAGQAPSRLPAPRLPAPPAVRGLRPAGPGR